MKASFIFLLSFFLCSIVYGNNDFLKAKQYYNNGFFSEAFQIFITLTERRILNEDYVNGSPFYYTCLFYYKGHVVKSNIKKAVAYCEEGAHIGDREAILLLAQIYYQIKIYQKSLHWALHTLKHQEQKDGRAYFMLAVHYYSGVGVSKDLSKSFEYFSKASQLGHAKSKYFLAKMYYDEEAGLSKDLNLVISLLQESVALGYEKAQDLLFFVLQEQKAN